MTSPWTLARRAARLEPSSIREILKLADRPGVISLAGGLPAADAFPVEAIREAARTVLGDTAREALQYAASEGHGPLREWIAERLAGRGLRVEPGQVLVTSGSQQGLDLVAKVLVDPGAPVAVESPAYLGALQAFAPFEPRLLPLAGDREGPRPESLLAAGHAGARFAYLQPDFQNPTGRCASAGRRRALVETAAGAGLPLVEDDPYGELWFDEPPPRPLAAEAAAHGTPELVLHLGSFSKVLVPGLRLGWLVAPPALFPKLLQAKQAADLHTPGFNQRLVHEVVKDGFLDRHLPAVRAVYRARRDAMRGSLDRHLADLGARWTVPAGGMFFWLTLPAGLDAAALLPRALEAGVAYVPGAPFFAAPDGPADSPAAAAARAARAGTLRLSYATVPPERIEAGVAALARVLRDALAGRWPEAA